MELKRAKLTGTTSESGNSLQHEAAMRGGAVAGRREKTPARAADGAATDPLLPVGRRGRRILRMARRNA